MVSSASFVALGAAVALLAAVLAGGSALRRGARSIGELAAAIADRQLADAFIFVDRTRLLRASAVVALAAALLALLLRVGPAGSLGLALALLILPRVGLAWLGAARQRRLVRQLPDAIQALAALLRAGHAFGQALAALAETQPAPLRDELRLVTRRLRLGERPDAVFAQLPERIVAPECRMLATTVRVALDLGGSLAEALENLATTTRRRLEMQDRIRALTSQGRLQGAIVGALPLLMIAALTLVDPDAMSLLWTRPQGWAALVLILALEACGFVLIRRIVRIDV